MAKNLVQIAWDNVGGEPDRLSFDKQVVKIPIREDYIENLDNPKIKEHIRKNISTYYYRFKTDVHVSINGKLVIGIECKNYTENAMLKRIMVDFTFLKQANPNVQAVLFQLESQLGGDYSKIFENVIYGSASTRTIMSHFDVDLLILTLLEGERKVDKPIHKPEYFKELKIQSVKKAEIIFEKILEPFV